MKLQTTLYISSLIGHKSKFILVSSLALSIASSGCRLSGSPNNESPFTNLETSDRSATDASGADSDEGPRVVAGLTQEGAANSCTADVSLSVLSIADIGSESSTSLVTNASTGAGYSSVVLDMGSDFISSNICDAKTILGRSGAATCVTGTADALAANVANGKTFWNAAGAPVTGTATVVTGTADAAVANVLSGKTFWNAAGATATGTMSDRGALSITDAATTSWSSGYYSGISLTPGHLATGNICSSNTILGVSGSATCLGGVGTGTIATASEIKRGYYSYGSSGTAINGTGAVIYSTSDWSARSLSAADGDYLLYVPTGTVYRFSSVVGDWVRSRIYTANLTVKGKITGDVVPANETLPSGGWTTWTAGTTPTITSDGTAVIISSDCDCGIASRMTVDSLAQGYFQGYLKHTNTSANSYNGTIFFANGSRFYGIDISHWSARMGLLTWATWSETGLLLKSVSLVDTYRWVEIIVDSVGISVYVDHETNPSLYGLAASFPASASNLLELRVADSTTSGRRGAITVKNLKVGTW